MKDNRSKTQQYYVVKSNELIQRVQYTLKLQQLRVLLCAISCIQEGDDVNHWYELSVSEICHNCGLNADTGTYYRIIKEIFTQLTQREWGIMPDGSLATISWIGDAKFPNGTGTIMFRFHEEMQPYLFGLKEHYTMYKLGDVLVLDSVGAIRLFELMKSFAYKRKTNDGTREVVRTVKTFTLDELKDAMGVSGGYPRWADFERYALRRSVDEINSKCTEMHIEYQPTKTGRSVTGVTFTIDPPRAIELQNAQKNKEARNSKNRAEPRRSKAEPDIMTDPVPKEQDENFNLRSLVDSDYPLTLEELPFG